MAELCNVLTEFPYAEAAAGSAKRTAAAPQDVPQSWSTSIVESTTVCTECKVFVIGGFDLLSQRIVSHVRMWDMATRVWTRLPDAPVRVAHASAAAVPDEVSIVLFGGWDGEGCSGELWHLYPLGSKGVAGAADGVPLPGPAGSGKGGGGSNASANARGRPAKGGEETIFQWSRIEADPLVSARPVGRYGHALVAGSCEPTTLWQTNAASFSEVAMSQSSGGPSTPAAVANVVSDLPTPATLEPVLYLFGGNDRTSCLNDVWRVWLTPSRQRGVAHWERLEVAPGVSPCPRENAALAFDATRQCLWLYGGRTATAVLDDLWCFSLVSTLGSPRYTWKPIQQLGGHTVAPTRRDLRSNCAPTAALVEDGSLYVVFSDTPASAKRLFGDTHLPLFRFNLSTYQQSVLSITEEDFSSRPSTSSRTSLRCSQKTAPYSYVASCACNQFVFWLKECVDDELANSNSRPNVVYLGLNVPPGKPTKRRTERNR